MGKDRRQTNVESGLNIPHYSSDKPDLDWAMKRFVEHTKSRQLQFLRTLLNAAEAEEVLQEAYLKIFLLLKNNPDKLPPLEQLMSMQPLLTTVVKNLAINNIRHQKVINQHLKLDNCELKNNPYVSAYQVEATLIQADEKALILAVINRLPPICRQVFVQRKLHGKSHAEIATMLGVSVKTVENHLAKGLLLCRKYINELQSEQARKGQPG